MEKLANTQPIDSTLVNPKLIGADEVVLHCSKLYKYNDFNMKQKRIIVITSKFVYNMKGKNIKRKISLAEVTATTQSRHPESQEFIIHVPSEYDYRYSSERRFEIIDVLRQEYYKRNGDVMKRYVVEEKHLKAYTTTKSDAKKKISRIPGALFLVVEFPSSDKDLSAPSSASTSPCSPEVLAEIEEPEFNKRGSKIIYMNAELQIEVTLEDFKEIKKIGEGGFGTVYLVERVKDKELFAMKQLCKHVLIQRHAITCAQLEKEILKIAKHPFLVCMQYVFQTATSIYFIMKFYRGGELYRRLKKMKCFGEEATKFYAAQIALALGELHRNKVIYRDMKPENILLDEDGYVALADFGLSKIVNGDESTTTFCGTPDYIAPEIVAGERYNKQVDWWGLGILIYELLFGVAPFRSRNQHLMFDCIRKVDVKFPNSAKISEESEDVIRKLLCKDPNKRLGVVNDAKDVLAHPFFSQIDVDKLLNKELEVPFKPPVNKEDKYDLQNFKKLSDPSLNIDEVDPKLMEIIEKYKVICM
eukprot:TRINITY_DN1189_c0_g1_i4.p1 TRINITY_DN1189_c0_g1~~TRINITY_DN1189_c0_g1_i4.p1  ORF type:complete len:530 (+),score=174.62 TRINITY_DN1189_c0_g1_i4:155-1744(+)